MLRILVPLSLSLALLSCSSPPEPVVPPGAEPANPEPAVAVEATEVAPEGSRAWGYLPQQAAGKLYIDVNRLTATELLSTMMTLAGEIAEQEGASLEGAIPPCLQTELENLREVAVAADFTGGVQGGQEALIAVSTASSLQGLSECLESLGDFPGLSNDPELFGGRPAVQRDSSALVWDRGTMLFGPVAKVEAALTRGPAPAPEMSGEKYLSYEAAVIDTQNVHLTDVELQLGEAAGRTELVLGANVESAEQAEEYAAQLEALRLLALHKMNDLTEEELAEISKQLPGQDIDSAREELRKVVEELELTQAGARLVLTLRLPNEMLAGILSAIAVHGVERYLQRSREAQMEKQASASPSSALN